MDSDLIELSFLKILWEKDGVKSIQSTQVQYYLSFLTRNLSMNPWKNKPSSQQNIKQLHCNNFKTSLVISLKSQKKYCEEVGINK